MKIPRKIYVFDVIYSNIIPQIRLKVNIAAFTSPLPKSLLYGKIMLQKREVLVKKMQKNIFREGHLTVRKLLVILLTVSMLFSIVGCLPQEDYDLPDDSIVTDDDDFSGDSESTDDTPASDIELPTDTTQDLPDSESSTMEQESEAESQPPIVSDTEPVTTEADTTESVETETAPPETTPPETTPPATEAQKDEPQIPINSTFSIHFIDAGQADAALVECDGHYMLIDGGNKGDSSKIYSVLKNEKISSLDIVVGTHAHEDHIGGLPGAFNYTTAALTLCPVTSYDSDAFGDFLKYANKSGGGITVPAVGDTYSLGSAEIEILGVNSASDANNSSIVLMITYGETKFLFTGDAEREAEQVILDSGADLSATVLKVGHHGSDSSSTYPFLREIMPKYAVISVGEDNSYGHPTENTLSRFRDAEVKVFRTDMQGDVYCTSDGKTVTFSVEKNANADTLTNPVKVVETQPPETTPPETEAPSQTGTDYVLNTNTKKFHYPSCSSVKRMSEKNKGYYTGTRDEVIAMGYDPCGNCHP